MAVDVSADDLATFLNTTFDEGQEARATFLIGQATLLAQSIVDPLPDTAEPVILSVAGRAWGNPQGASSQTAGPFAVQQPGGLYLTRQDRAALKRLAGKGGAFTIDPTPAEVDVWATWPLPEFADDPERMYAESGEPGWDPW